MIHLPRTIKTQRCLIWLQTQALPYQAKTRKPFLFIATEAFNGHIPCRHRRSLHRIHTSHRGHDTPDIFLYRNTATRVGQQDRKKKNKKTKSDITPYPRGHRPQHPAGGGRVTHTVPINKRTTSRVHVGTM